MTLKKKLAGIFIIVVSVIMILNNLFHFISTRENLQKDQEMQMDQLAKQIGISIEQAQFGSQYVEDLIGDQLRVASLAAQNALNPDIDQVTNEDLKVLSEKIGVSYITLLKQEGDDIKGVRSSDPKERNLSTKEWGYWFDAFKELFATKNVTVSQGQKLPNYWSGPVNISASNPDHVDKWGYYYDGTTNYIISPYMRVTEILNVSQILGPESTLEKIMSNNKAILEITGFNPKAFGQPPVYTEVNGQKYIDLVNRDIQFGKYTFKNQTDVQTVKTAFETGKMQNVISVINGKKVFKTFVPIATPLASPYIVGIVTDYRVIEDILDKEIIDNIIISLFVLFSVSIIGYLLASYIVKPINRILHKVNEVAEGNFDARIAIDRHDELGLLSERVNTMSMNLQTNTQELVNKNKEIEFHANYDFLTGLPNLRLFSETFQKRIESAAKHDSSIAVLFIDLDRFKWINDTYGHSVGDYFLKETSKRITHTLKANELGSRIGGDEFILLLLGYSQETIAEKAEQISTLLSQPLLYEGQEISVTPSIGISLFPENGDSVETLVKHADIAMYRAKEQGRNNYQFYACEMEDAIVRRAVLENGIRKALERNEFILYYQPQIDLETKKIVGLEALVRWIHPEHGLISPVEFIPIAEETGLIVPIGEWILQTACEQAKLWQVQGFPKLRISVNLSARQVQQKNLVEKISSILQTSELEPELLELEITESIAMYNEEYVINKLLSLKKIGIKIAIDDFGTGYSSLNYLNKFPIDTLKIDRSFVNQIKNTTDNQEIITTIIVMARNLKLKVIAEGVETVEQLRFLEEQQCNEVQGFYFSKPLTVEGIQALLKQPTWEENN
ncbi:putative bifunctional diguanylate cyclase/phosphodiesterase [Paenibacillus baimaensis]|uniref:putative bifunctional diguanylate cyclase/phosphodiesterase n=1 Tax=Paenibacillus baimaensis TaxID=2982185 RepID=UPI0021D3E609|nr:EAL domain-containing protein [Paenibacillus sp. WQ 127069]